MPDITLHGLPTLVLDADAPAEAPIIVAMHGIGSNEQDLAPVYRALARQAVLVFPRSPLAHPPGYAWYRLIRIGVPDPGSFEQALLSLGQWIGALRATADYADRPLILSGFSQGAIMALSYALRHPGEVDGVIAFSGYIPDIVTQALPAGPTDRPLPRFFLAHGRRDQLFPISRLDETAALLRSRGAQPTVVAHDGGHDIPLAAVEAVGKWLEEGAPASPGVPDAAVAAYRRVRPMVPGAGRIAVLHVGPEVSGVAVGTSDAPDATLTMSIGSRKIANDHFRHSPPTAVELETGIMIVEDEVTRVQRILGGEPELFTDDASIREIARSAGERTDRAVVLTVEQVERTFNRMAAVSLGRPMAQEGLPENNEFAATLLIVREFMHHLGFSRLTILA